MCPSGGQGGGHWVRLRRSLRETVGWELQPSVLLVPAALTLLLVVYLFPLLSALALCAGGGCWASRNSWPLASRLPDWWQRVGGAAGGRVRPVPHRRHRQPASKWSQSPFLVLMGSYLGKPEPPARELGRGAQDLKERLSRPNPTVPTPARRLSFRETPRVSTRTYMSPRRRYPIHQPQYSIPGSLPTVYLENYQRKCLLSPKSTAVRSPVTVKIARPDLNITRSPVLHNLLSPGPVSPAVQCAPDPCAKETVLNAIRESRKRVNKDEDYNGSRELDSKRRRQASSGSGESSFESPVQNGSPSSYVVKPDNLKRGLNTPLLDENITKRSRTSSNSSLYNLSVSGIAMSTHNAITSSYSSSRDLLQKRKRSNHNISAVSSSPSSRSQTPDLASKKSREELHESSPSSPVGLINREPSGQFNENNLSKSSTGNSSFENGSSGNRRKKVLLVCSGRTDHYPMPPPPLVGYSITSKDFDAEKKAFLQRLNKALEETPDSAPVSSASSTTTSVPTTLFSLPTTTAATLAAQPSTTNSNPLLQSLAKMQNKEASQAPAHTVNGNVPTLTLSSANDTSKLNALQPPSQPAFTAAVTLGNTTAPQAAQAAQPKSQSPKNNLQSLANSLESGSQSTFKPLFPSSEGAKQPTLSSSLLSTTSIPATNTFKPIFGDQSSQQSQPAGTFKPIFGDQNSQQGQPAGTFKPIFGEPAAQQPVSSASPFTFQMNSTTASSTPSLPVFGATTASATSSTGGNTKTSMSLPTSNSTTTSNFSLSSFPLSGTANSVSAPNSVNPFTGSNTSADSQAKSTSLFGQKPTSQETSNLSVFGNTQAQSSQPQQPPMFGSTTSAFTAPLVSNSSSFPANSGSSLFSSSSGGAVQADKPTPSPLASFGVTGGQTAFNASTPSFAGNSQTTFGASSQAAFGTNSNFTFATAPATSKAATFGNMNNTQTISNPTNVFAAKPFPFGETTNTVSSFGTNTATTPALSFDRNSVAQGNINQSTPNFGTPAPMENKVAFATPFGSNPSAGFGVSTPAAFASPVTSFSQQSPGFSIGSSKHSGPRQRLSARRQHPRKK